ncbi:MAG: signal peptidase II [Candidatus Limnocylindrales bacterium]
MTGPTADDGGSQLDQSHAPIATTTAGRLAWILFLGVAATIVVVDQLTKAWVVASIVPGSAIRVVGDLLRLIHSKNDGALFGLFGGVAPVVAAASLVVIGLIVWFHVRSGRNLLLSLALGLLLGGALGNLLDRIRHGYVVDWVDAGIGTLRFWTFNVGDAAISLAILLLLLIALRPGLGGASSDG